MKGDYVIHLLSRTRDRIQKFLGRELEKQGIQDIAPAHAGVLFVLSKNGAMRMSELATILDRTNSTATALLDKMEEFGYVIRTKLDPDERVTTADLTEKGKRSVEKVIKASKITLNKLYKGLDETEKAEFVRLLSKIHANFEI
ncbi:MarR family winged helix-turn-helix transcriptional regulator [Leptospira inadai]|nr:MarR family transcriptional regulator [Leptospira inadai]PNV72291.1 MarR family transcriptional regulator [Leptospira inadai serovar Lyme]